MGSSEIYLWYICRVVLEERSCVGYIAAALCPRPCSWGLICNSPIQQRALQLALLVAILVILNFYLPVTPTFKEFPDMIPPVNLDTAPVSICTPPGIHIYTVTPIGLINELYNQLEIPRTRMCALHVYRKSFVPPLQVHEVQRERLCVSCTAGRSIDYWAPAGAECVHIIS